MSEPKTLYKYRYFDEKGFHLDIVKSLQLWFASPDNLNDPFDCKIRERYDLQNDKEWKDTLFEYLKALNPHLHPNKLDKEFKTFYKPKEQIDFDEFIRGINSIVNDKIGICSFSETENNNALWSLYSDRHTGFVIEFNFMNLKKDFRNYMFNAHAAGKKHEIAIYDTEVKYYQDAPVVIPKNNNRNFADYYSKIFSLKSIDWEYEKEYRFFSIFNTNSHIPIRKESISRVIAGINISNDNFELLESACNKNEITIQKARFDPFSLKAVY